MSYTPALLRGIALDLAEAQLAAWSEDAKYPEAGPGIVIGDVTSRPSTLIALNDYDTTESVEDNEVITFVQIKTRFAGHPLDEKEWLDAIRDRFHRRQHFSLGNVELRLSWRASRAQLGRDANGRFLHSQNFAFAGPRWLPALNTPSGD